MTSDRIKYLAKKIVKASNDYYNGNPSVTDKVWDAWHDELKKLAPDHPVVTGVGAIPVSSWNKVQHEVPMASLNKVNTPDEFFSWVKNDCKDIDDYVIADKLDGISISIKYENGNFAQALTRGDGQTGEDISQNVLKMKGVLQKLKKSYTGHIRGEIVLLKSDHKLYFSDYANPRNAASGIAKRYDGDGSEHLTVLFYKSEHPVKYEIDNFKYIESLGLKTPRYQKVSANDVVKVWNEYQDSIRESLDYEIDGNVISVNDMEAQLSLGLKGRGPAGAIAFKFEAISAETTIKDIVWQVGNSGRITPVAIFDEIDLGGAKVKRASLYNLAYIEEIGVGIGAKVIVCRANDVIPRVEEVVEKTTISKAPKYCPECDSVTTSVGQYIICPNKETCPAQVLGRISIWVSELGILDWGDKVLKKMIDAELISDVADIYKLTEPQIAALDKMGDRSARALLQELDKYREVSLANLIGGLGIENIGTSMVKLVISAGFDSIDKMRNASISQIENIPGFAYIKAKSFCNGLKQNHSRIEDILKHVKIKKKVQGTLSGKSFCFTGSSNLPRKVLQKIVEDNGGEVKTSVGKGLGYLVMADADSTSAKAKAAKKNNTSVISEEDFLKMAGHNV